MHIDILTLFPDMFHGVFGSSLIGRAVARGLVRLAIYNLRDFAHDRHHVVDDYPYGGGPGMVLKPEPIFEAVESIRGDGGGWVILLTPQGRPFTQEVAEELAGRDRLILVCGHYEGVDERVREHLVDDEISIGDYILSGGEIAAMVVVDAVLRLVPGVLGSAASGEEDSHVWGLLEYPQYTRPPEFRGWKVPPVLLSGNHGEISRWRREQAILRTLRRRPDLLERASLTSEERRRLGEVVRAESGKENHGS
ncbi:MAG: tRNA (guanosine(37)-N1)-methyltransferase TrmD [Dehalococcoidia bacterium]